MSLKSALRSLPTKTLVFMLISGLLVIATFVGVFVARNNADEAREQTKKQQADDLRDVLQRGFDGDVRAVNALQAFYNSQLKEGLQPDEVRPSLFHAFALGLDREDVFSALSFAPIVPRSQLVSFESMASEALGRSYHIFRAVPSGMGQVARRSRYCPIYLVDPTVGNEESIGLDACSDRDLSDPIRTAIKSGKPSVTQRLELLQNKGQAAVVLFDPLYSSGRTPVDADARQRQAVGLVVGFLRIADTARILANQQDFDDLNYALYDRHKASKNSLLYSTVGVGPKFISSPVRKHINVAGRSWLVVAWPKPGRLLADHRLSWLLLILGLAVLLPFLTALARELRSKERELRRRNSELEATNRALVRSNAELEQFAYAASHDLQEPLRMVSNYVGLLAKRYKGRLDDQADTFINYAEDGADRMQRLIEDLLILSQAGSGDSFSDVDLEQVLAEVKQNLSAAITESKATVKFSELPTVRGDRTRLVQLLQNLVSNAIKYHGTEAPAIEISAQQKEWEWLISVADNGCGIETAFQEQIFLPFKRLQHRQGSGTGIGLAICRRIVEFHGGQIWLRSELGKGSTFYFTISGDPNLTERGPSDG